MAHGVFQEGNMEVGKSQYLTLVRLPLPRCWSTS